MNKEHTTAQNMQAINTEGIKFERYPAYKDSGVEWLGEVPAHWEVSRLKNHINLLTGFPFKSEKYTEKGIKLARGINVKEGQFDWSDTKCWPIIEQHLKKYLLKDGDILIGMDGSKVGKNFCKVNESDLPILLLQRVARLRVERSLTSEFLYFQIYCRNFLKWVEMNKTDPMVPHIAPKDIFNFIIPIPPLPEQTRIATFLDHKTALIDQAIAQKERLIGLLQERRQVLIHRAVTRGLKPEVPMKDSGVEWIGEVPGHWEVKRLSTFGSFSKGGGISRSDLTSEGYPAILYGDIYTKYDICTVELFNKVPLEITGRSVKIQLGDLLLTGSGETREEIGKCVVYLNEEPAFAGGDIIIFRQKEYDSLFISFVLNSHGAIFEKARHSKGEIVVHTYASKLKDIFIPIPPLSEQKEISNYLSIQESLLKKSTEQLQHGIQKLQELKTTLIDAAVTGKVRVGQDDRIDSVK